MPVKLWRCEIFTVEVGALGFISRAVLSLLRRIGIKERRCQKALRELASAAEASGLWICHKHMQKDFTFAR